MKKFIFTSAIFIAAACFVVSCEKTPDNSGDKKDVTVTFDSQGGTPVASQTVKSGERVTMPQDPTKADGSKFDGWYTEPAAGTRFDFANTGVTHDITLYVHWVAVYTVTFVYGNGNPDSQVSVPKNGAVTRPSDPSRADYEFAGWFVSSGDTSPFDFSTPVTADLTLTAKWESLMTDAKVTFYQNLTDETTKEEVTVTRGGTVTAPATISPASCVAIAWYTDKQCTQEYNFASAVNTSFSLWAKWQLKDIDDNLYPIVPLTANGATKWWTAKNLAVTKFSDGSAITLAQAPGEWEVAGNAAAPAYCQIGYDYTPAAEMEARTGVQGLHYNWYVASDTKGVCPQGWSAPAYGDLDWLRSLPYPYAYSLSIDENLWGAAAGQTPEEGSPAYDWTTNNSTGFNMRPSPFRMSSGWYAGDAFEIRVDYRIWARTDGSGGPNGAALQQNGHEPWTNVELGGSDPASWCAKGEGYHIRCLKN